MMILTAFQAFRTLVIVAVKMILVLLRVLGGSWDVVSTMKSTLTGVVHYICSYRIFSSY